MPVRRMIVHCALVQTARAPIPAPCRSKSRPQRHPATSATSNASVSCHQPSIANELRQAVLNLSAHSRHVVGKTNLASHTNWLHSTGDEHTRETETIEAIVWPCILSTEHIPTLYWTGIGQQPQRITS